MSRQLVSLLALAVLPASCLTPTRGSQGLREVDDLGTRVEHVYVECEVGRARLRESFEALQKLVREDRDVDPVAGFSAFVESLDRFDAQAEALGSAITPMTEVAGSFFARWRRDLDHFTSAEMRLRSEARLEATRERYQAIERTATPAHETFQGLALRLRDVSLFLGNDLNASSIAAISGDLRTLSSEAATLDARFQSCMDAAVAYVQATALPVHVRSEPVEENEPVELTSGSGSNEG